MGKDYYVFRARASDLIDTMISEGKNDDEILYRLTKVYGFGMKLITERRELLERLVSRHRESKAGEENKEVVGVGDGETDN